MKKGKCPNKAVYAVPWGSKILMSCDVHGNAMAALGRAIGSPVEVRAINGDQKCEHPNDLDDYEKARNKTD